MSAAAAPQAPRALSDPQRRAVIALLRAADIKTAAAVASGAFHRPTALGVLENFIDTAIALDERLRADLSAENTQRAREGSAL